MIVTTVYDKTAKEVVPGTKKKTDFSPEKPDGIVTVNITVDASGRWLHQLVVFEEVYLVTENGQVLAGQHKDANDQAQTIFLPGFTPQTGDPSRLILPLAGLLGSGAGILCLCRRRRKFDEKNSDLKG